MKLYIIIVNFRDYQSVQNCLKGLYRNLPIKYLNIILVDNQSTLEIGRIKSLYPQITLIKNKKNLGFSQAVNQGIEVALKNQGTDILLLNPDTICQNDFISELLKSKYDLVSPILKFKKRGEWWYDYGGKINWLFTRTYHLESKIYPDPTLTSPDINLDYLSGCCLLIRNRVFEKIGLFDEKYFLYFEDVDFCQRALKSGFSLGIMPGVTLEHFLDNKKSHNRKTKIDNLIKSHRIFIRQNTPIIFRFFGLIYNLYLRITLVHEK